MINLFFLSFQTIFYLKTDIFFSLKHLNMHVVWNKLLIFYITTAVKTSIAVISRHQKVVRKVQILISAMKIEVVDVRMRPQSIFLVPKNLTVPENLCYINSQNNSQIYGHRSFRRAESSLCIATYKAYCSFVFSRLSESIFVIIRT